MKTADVFHTKPSPPRIVGTGLLALDIVISDTNPDDAHLWAGGTCGNVIAILGYLGWDALPLARLKSDKAADHIVEDLEEWGVDLSYVTREEDGSTPIIIQHIKSTCEGKTVHSFSLRCPCCGEYLPSYRPVKATAAKEMACILRPPDVFFFDRPSRGALELAAAFADEGALIVFEPSGLGDKRLLREAVSLCHVLKYAHERAHDFAGIGLLDGPLLEIETQGDAGLRFRRHWLPRRAKRWHQMAANHVERVEDAAGCGDWCMAGVIHLLGQEGLDGFKSRSVSEITSALEFGQALAAWNCCFQAARGGMYRVSRQKFRRSVKRILSGNYGKAEFAAVPSGSVEGLLSGVCPTCNGTKHKRARVSPGTPSSSSLQHAVLS